MKKFFVVFFLCAVLFSACGRNEESSPDALDGDTSYAFGMLIAGQMGMQGISLDYHAFMEGFRDFNEDRETRLTHEQAIDKVMAALARMEAQNEEDMWLESQRNLEEGEAYMAANAERPGVQTTASGLQYEVITQGTGERPGIQDTVLVHYEGTFLDGTVFDSSFQRGEPTQFPLGMVIQGWIEGLQLMNAGSTYRFVIPAHLANGQHGARPIPPNATLIFVIEHIDIIR